MRTCRSKATLGDTAGSTRPLHPAPLNLLPNSLGPNNPEAIPRGGAERQKLRPPQPADPKLRFSDFPEPRG